MSKDIRIPRPKLIVFFLCFSISFFACKKEETIKVNWVELQSPTDIDLSSVYFTSPDHGHAVGGLTWSKGVYLHTTDAGASWKKEDIADKRLFDLHFNEQGIGHTVGIDGYLFSNDFTNNNLPFEDWTFHRMPRWDILRGVAFNSRNEGVLVGGVAFAEGAIMTVDNEYLVPKTHTFENQLNAVCYSDDNTIHAAGYGLILRSIDKGETWIESPVSGDFFQAITFPTALIGYMVGYNGTILKTADAGVSWKKIRKGDAIAVSDQPFLSVHFLNEEEGYIVGDKGLCWKTADGGDNWQIIGDLPGFDFQDVFVTDNFVYIVGENGRMLQLDR